MKNKTLMKTLSAFLAVVMVLCSAPLNGFVGLEFPELKLPEWSLFDFGVKAEATTYRGYCGDNVKWSLDTESGVLNITGNGAMYDYDVALDAPWDSYCSSIKTINIEKGVTSIGKRAFLMYSDVDKVIIENSVNVIGDYAFAGCTSLTEIKLSDSIEYIGDYAFLMCASLKMVDFGNSENFVLNDTAFSSCQSIESFKIGSENINYSTDENGVLYNKTKTEIIKYPVASAMTEYIIVPTVTHINKSAFAYSNRLKNVIFPENLVSIGERAFYSCSLLEKINLPESLVELGDHSFAKCSKLNEIFINCANLEYSMFPFCGSGIETDGVSVVFTDKVQAIKQELLLRGCTDYFCSNSGEKFNLTSVTVGENVSEIGNYAFSDTDLIEFNFNAVNCTFSVSSLSNMISLSKINIGNKVKRIPEYFATNCDALTDVIIPESVSDIGQYAFSDCENLENVVFLGKDGIYIGDNIFDYSPKATICCKENSYMHYYADINAIRYCIIDEANNPTYEIKNEVLIIYTGCAESLYLNFASRVGYGAFGGNTLLKQIELSSCIDRIYDRAFTECENLETIIIPKSVISIGGNAFYGCDKLTIYCYAGSYAETYAKEHDIKYDYITLDLTESNVKLYSDEVLNLGTAYNIDIVDSEEVLWISDNESVVKVAQNGKITAIGEGTATITAKTESGLEAECTVTVNAGKRPAVEGVTVSDFTVSYKVTTKIEPDVKFAGDVDYIVEYSSSNESVVTVDKDGNVIATGTGEAEITVTVTDEYGNVVEDTCRVTVSYAWWQWLIIIFLFGWIWY